MKAMLSSLKCLKPNSFLIWESKVTVWCLFDTFGSSPMRIRSKVSRNVEDSFKSFCKSELLYPTSISEGRLKGRSNLKCLPNPFDSS